MTVWKQRHRAALQPGKYLTGPQALSYVQSSGFDMVAGAGAGAALARDGWAE